MTTSSIDFASLRRREEIVSAAINAVLSFGFFALVFGLGDRPLTMAAPDRFALDFLPQALMVSLMASLVPSLLVRSKLVKAGLASTTKLAGIVARGTAIGLASGGLLAAVALVGPWSAAPSHPALVFKIVYGAVLGLVSTRLALSSLLAKSLKEQPA